MGRRLASSQSIRKWHAHWDAKGGIWRTLWNRGRHIRYNSVPCCFRAGVVFWFVKSGSSGFGRLGHERRVGCCGMRRIRLGLYCRFYIRRCWVWGAWSWEGVISATNLGGWFCRRWCHLLQWMTQLGCWKLVWKGLWMNERMIKWINRVWDIC